MRTLIFVAASVFAALPFVTPWFFERFGGPVSELEAKYILFLLFALGGLAACAGSEAVLPAYISGMVLAGTVGKDHVLIRRLRTLTFGLLTPFSFIRAGSLVSVPAPVGAPLVFLALLAAKMLSKMIPLVPTRRAFNYLRQEGMYYSLMMSTAFEAFGTIAALFGPPHRPSSVKRSGFTLGGDRHHECDGAHCYRQRVFHAPASLVRDCFEFLIPQEEGAFWTVI